MDLDSCFGQQWRSASFNSIDVEYLCDSRSYNTHGYYYNHECSTKQTNNLRREEKQQ